MAKLRKVTLYVFDMDGNQTDHDIAMELKSIKHLPFVAMGDIDIVDIGEWHDDHELNKFDADYRKWFKETT